MDLGGPFAVGVSNCHPAERVLAAIEDAERMGAEVAFVSEDIGCRDAFELCALATSRTSRLRLGTGVVNPYTRSPVSLAMSAATLDEISGGRALLGLGSSSPSLIQVQLGIPPGRSVQVMREAAGIVRALLRGETVTFQGERFNYAEALLDISPGERHIPIFFAAMGPRMLRLAGEVADGVLLNVGASPTYVQWARREIERGAEQVGRSASQVTVAAWLAAYVTENREEGIRSAQRGLARMLSVPRQGELLLEHGGHDSGVLACIRRHFQAYPHRGDVDAAARCVPSELAEALAVVGGPDEVRARIGAYRAAGVDLPVLGIGALRALA